MQYWGMTLSDEFPKGKFSSGVLQNNTDTVGAISVVLKS